MSCRRSDTVLLSHAHFDHFDLRTLHRFDHSTKVVTARRTRDLLRWTRLRDVTELRRGERTSIKTSAGNIDIVAFRVKHWGARVQRGEYRGYNGYVLEREGRRIVFGGDTAMTDSFGELREKDRVDCDPEQAVQMANDAGAQFGMPVHYQTFRLSSNRFANRLNASKRRFAKHRSGSPCARLARRFCCRRRDDRVEIKHQLPTSKSQRNFNHPNSKQERKRERVFWTLKFGASLDVGAWSLELSTAASPCLRALWMQSFGPAPT
jgi:hypothetical protein